MGVDELPGLDPLEAMPLQELRVRCFQQRPGNSARPEVDPGEGVDGQIGHVSELGWVLEILGPRASGRER